MLERDDDVVAPPGGHQAAELREPQRRLLQRTRADPESRERLLTREREAARDLEDVYEISEGAAVSHGRKVSLSETFVNWKV